MTAEKKAEPGAKASAFPGTTRKSWMPRSTVEGVLEQIAKREKRVADLEKTFDAEKATLNKLLQAKKVLEAT